MEKLTIGAGEWGRGDDCSRLESTSVFTYYNALAILILIIY